jgi:hypothetical protein
MSEDSPARLKLNCSRDFIAEDNNGLFYLLQSERSAYSAHLEKLTNVRLDQGIQFSVTYESFDAGSDADDFDPADVRAILPNSLGPEGQLLLLYLEAEEKEKYTDIVYAFFVENGWAIHPFTEQYAVQNNSFRQPQSIRSYLRGLALLAGARTQEICNPAAWTDAALAESQSQVRTQLGKLKSEMTQKDKLLQHQLAQFQKQVGKSDDDRRQMRRIFLTGLRLGGGRTGTDRENWSEKYKATYDQFTNQLQYKSAVKLWTDRAATHATNAAADLKILLGAGAAFSAIAILVVICAGPSIAAAFVSTKCTGAGQAQNCVQAFSPLGPLVLSTILFVTSLSLWFLRMLNKVYLSERHLHLDATERKAFAETYLALREDASVSENHEAIVLGALFRSTQDGMVKDDMQTLDPSIASILAKRFSV